MNRLLNALAFAAVVIAAFVMDSNLPQRVASSPLVARVVNRVRCERPAHVVVPDVPPQFEQAAMVGLPQLDQARLERAMARMQVTQERLARVNMKQVEVKVRMAQRAAAAGDCKVVKIDQ